MILAALALFGAGPETALDAERAFAADAQAKGQWTAFRAFAAPDATMFVPQPVKAQDWLKDRKDPPKAVEWWPTASYVSCDGGLAVNTGGWKQADGSVGYFTTVWRHQPDGSWKWIVDSGDAATAIRPHPAEPKTTRAACTASPTRAYLGEPVEDPEQQTGMGYAPDGSIVWEWRVTSDGSRVLKASLWTGARYELVLEDRVAAPK